MKRYLLPGLLALFANVVFSQNDPVLMTINGKEIFLSEFEYIYSKNNASFSSGKLSIQEYLELFINFKVKVLQAEKLGIDTTADFITELAGYRQQFAKKYLPHEIEDELYLRPIYESHKKKYGAGEIEILQIFKYLPQNTSNKEQHLMEIFMDSLYTDIKRNSGKDFEKYVSKFSDEKEKLSINWWDVPQEFEKNIFSLDIGDIKAPFFTPQGVHIIKILAKKNVKPFIEVRDELARRYIRKNEINRIEQEFLNRAKTTYNFNYNQPAVNEFLHSGTSANELFTIGGISYTCKHYQLFTEGKQGTPENLLNKFVVKSIYDYEDSQLETNYPEFRLLMDEFRDGMLLFEISNREVWEKSITDKAGLQAYFATYGKNHSGTQEVFEGVVIRSTKKKHLRLIKKLLRDISQDEWVDFLEYSFGNNPDIDVLYQGGVFRKGENDVVDKQVFKKGKISPLKKYPHAVAIGKKQQLTLNSLQTKGEIITDYQNFLEKQWVQGLRAQSKVEINQEVLKTVNYRSSN